MNTNHDDTAAATRRPSSGELAIMAYGIEQAVTRAFGFLDQGSPERFAAAFAENGSWFRRSGTKIGRNAIIDEMRYRPQGRLVRHLISNFVFAELGSSYAEVTFLSLAFSDDQPVVGIASMIRPPVALDEYRASLIARDEIWLLTTLRRDRLFESNG